MDRIFFGRRISANAKLLALCYTLAGFALADRLHVTGRGAWEVVVAVVVVAYTLTMAGNALAESAVSAARARLAEWRRAAPAPREIVAAAGRVAARAAITVRRTAHELASALAGSWSAALATSRETTLIAPRPAPVERPLSEMLGALTAYTPPAAPRGQRVVARYGCTTRYARRGQCARTWSTILGAR